jgi:hypothetical protein
MSYAHHPAQRLKPSGSTDAFTATRSLQPVTVSRTRLANAPITAIATTTAINRHRRSPELVRRISQLDVQTDPNAFFEVLAELSDKYGEILGLFSRCYLGDGYIDHRLDTEPGGWQANSGDQAFDILEHYRASDVVPDPFSAARTLAAHSAYAYIEVYDGGRLVPIYSNGLPGEPIIIGK